MFSNVAALLMAGLLATAPNERAAARYRWGDPVDVALRAGKNDEVLALVDRDPTLLRAVSREMKAQYGGETLLHRAAADGNVKLIEGLLDRGAEIDLPAVEEHGNGFTPHAAAFMGHVPAIELLVERHANKDAEARGGNTPARKAASRAHLDAARALLKAGAKNDEFVAAGLGQLEFLKERHSEARPVTSLRDGDQRTPLHYAAINGQLDVARWLIELGADVDAESSRQYNGHGFKPLHEAAWKDRVLVARLLLDAGAEVNAPGNGFAPLHLADSVEMARLLLSRGADVNVKLWHDGRTPLHSAAIDGNLELVKLFIESGADVNAKCDQARGVNAAPTPSYEAPTDSAAWYKHADVLDYLRKHGGRRKADKTP